MKQPLIFYEEYKEPAMLILWIAFFNADIILSVLQLLLDNRQNLLYYS